MFDNLPFSSSAGIYSIGMDFITYSGSNTPLKNLLTAYAGFYEQYRIRKVTMRAQVGSGYTNDRRIKTIVGCRVDVDGSPSAATVANVQYVNSSENCVTKTFSERGNVVLSSFRPQCRIKTSGISFPILPNQLNWFPIADHLLHVWKGSIVTCLIPETGISPNALGVTLVSDLVVEFRGRITDPAVFTSSAINQSEVPIVYDIQGTLADMRANFLNGTYHPGAGFENINVANIGTSVTEQEILNAKFRVNSTQIWYVVAAFDTVDSTFGANQE